MRLLAAMICTLALGACTTTYPGAPASAHDDERFGDEAAFILGIDAGRISVFNDRIASAGELVMAPETGGDELIGVSKRLRAATFEFLVNKERLCADLKFMEQSCATVTPPVWLARDPNEPITPRQLNARIEEVQELMGPLLDVACTTGKEKSGDGLFCSVE